MQSPLESIWIVSNQCVLPFFLNLSNYFFFSNFYWPRKTIFLRKKKKEMKTKIWFQFSFHYSFFFQFFSCGCTCLCFCSTIRFPTPPVISPSRKRWRHLIPSLIVNKHVTLVWKKRKKNPSSPSLSLSLKKRTNFVLLLSLSL